MSTPYLIPADQRLRRAILGLLHSQTPPDDLPVVDLDTCFDRLECGGYIHSEWSRAGRLGALPPGWSGTLARAYHKTVVDNLVALAEFRRLSAHLVSERAEFVLLKGASYLSDLYADPGCRRLTDIDLLIHRDDAGRVARRLLRSGFRGAIDGHFPDNRRFEIWFPGSVPCRFEFHWSLGLPLRAHVDQRRVWENSSPAMLENTPCRRLATEDAILYHAVHAADHYFGPTLKWAIDLREMLRQWRPDCERLLDCAASWRCRSALHLSLRHVEKLFPGEVPDVLMRRTKPRGLRGELWRRSLASDPLALLSVTADSPWRYPLRCLMLDRVSDAVLLTLQVLARPLTRRFVRLRRRAGPPWEWRD